MCNCARPWLLLALCGSSCSTVARTGPKQSVELVGFTRNGVVVERVDGPRRTVEHIRLPAGPSVVLGVGTAAHRGAAAVGAIAPGVQTSMAIELTRVGSAGDRARYRLVAREGAEAVRLAEIALQATLSSVWEAPDGRHGVAVLQTRAGQSLEVLDLAFARAQLVNLRALAAYRAGRHDDAAALWESAMALDPSFGDPAYNLACVHARAGDERRAKDELRLAIAIDPVRYRRLAADDADLASVREDEEIRTLLGLPAKPEVR